MINFTDIIIIINVNPLGNLSIDNQKLVALFAADEKCLNITGRNWVQFFVIFWVFLWTTPECIKKRQHLCCFALVDNWQNHLIIKGSILVYSVFYLRIKYHFVSILNLLAVNGNHKNTPHENPAIAKNFRHKVPLLVTFGRSPLWAYSIELNQVNGLFMWCHSEVP